MNGNDRLQTTRRSSISRISRSAIFYVVLTAGFCACSSHPRTEGAVADGGGAIIGAAVSPRTSQTQPLNAQPGLWKIEATSGNFRVPIKHCLTAQDIADPKRVAKVFGHPFNPITSSRPDPGYHTLADQVQQTCDYADVKQASDSLAFKYSCKGGFSSTEEGSLKFDTPTHYSGVFNFTGDDANEVRPASPTISTEGSRVGDCSASTIDGSHRP